MGTWVLISEGWYDTLFTEVVRRDGWVNIRLPSGQTGWVSARYVGCCRTVASSPGTPSGAAASSCEELWTERNAIFKAAGYCFRTPQAIRAFGNAGCQHDNEADVPLSAREREQVAGIRISERSLGCTHRRRSRSSRPGQAGATGVTRVAFDAPARQTSPEATDRADGQAVSRPSAGMCTVKALPSSIQPGPC
ncbi:YARHG domain-containing protein [Methylobacterium sp. M6A4_1b]